MRVSVRYEWDDVKREKNLVKHGLAFNDAWQVYENPLKLDGPSERQGEEGRRQAFAYAEIAQTVCMLAYIERDASVRCISFRRANSREKEEYHDFVRTNRQLHE